jgi:hypothetical protein
MPIRPYQYLTLLTPLKPAEVEKRLVEQVETDLTADAMTTKLFMGVVKPTEFEIYRRIQYTNSFLPVIDGTVSELSDGTAVEIVMRLAPPVVWFMIFWILFTGGLGTYIVWSTNSIWALQAFGMLAFGYVLATFGFSVESKKATSALKMILDAKEA